MLTNKQQKALEILSKANAHYDRVNNDTWVLWTSGFKTGQHIDSKMFLQTSNFICAKEKFDRVCGKTALYFKPIKKAV